MIVASETEKPIFEILKNIHQYAAKAGLNAATVYKLNEFTIMIKSFMTMLNDHDVYEVSMHVAKTAQLIKNLKEDDTPEGISRLENVQELLNSIKGYVEEQIQVEDGNPTLSGFLENVALSDRKSTRLNSSHVAISYAVFCFIKKN